MEELGRVLAPVPLHSTMTAALTIAEAGTEDQKRDLLPAVCSGDMVMTWAVIEARPAADSIRPSLEQAQPDGDGWILNGVKMFVDNFNVAKALLWLAVRTAPGIGDSNEGISLFLIDPNGSGVSQTPLVTIAKDKQSRVDFNGVRVRTADLVGELHNGWPIVERMLERATALLCCQMIGATRKDAELAIDYAKNRVAFGRPIASFPVDSAHVRRYAALHRRCAAPDLRALWKMDQGLPAGVEVSQAKAFRQRKVRGGGATVSGHPRRYRLHDGVRPAPVAAPSVGLDHAAGNHLRPPGQDRQRTAGQAGQSAARSCHCPPEETPAQLE